MGALDLADIQGIVARGYVNHRGARYSLLRITDASAARRWLAALPVTPASDRAADPALNVAFTAAGLSAIGLAPDVVSQFDSSFVAGMTDPTRSRLLGDTGANAVAEWPWGKPSDPPVHLIALLFSADDERLAVAQSWFSAGLAAAGLTEVVGLDTADNGDREPFGFHDSISQPIIEGLSKSGPASNTVKAGEFILGYRNEYGLYTDRPLLAHSTPGAHLLPTDPAGSGRADLGRNGSYLVLRELRQDVFGFWRYLGAMTSSEAGDGGAGDGEAGDGGAGDGRAGAQVRLGARLVGRWPGGAPLVLSPEWDDPSLSHANDFAYHGADPEGLACPIGAHVRRTNPRDSLAPDPGSQASIDIGKRHRLLRRGREYGPPANPEQLARGIDDGVERGLHFICLCANISRQFEFIQHTWVNNPRFDGLYQDPDPLVAGRRRGADCFTIQGRPVRTRLTGLPQFVTVSGGAYFFLPGLGAIRYLAGLGS